MKKEKSKQYTIKGWQDEQDYYTNFRGLKKRQDYSGVKKAIKMLKNAYFLE